MNATPSISILTPVWNGLPYIKETIESVLAEEFQDWELIIGDNESTDGTSEYLRTLTDPRIRVYRHEKNMGVYRNIRFLYANARAPIAVGLCADDYFHPGGLSAVVKEWSKATPETAYIVYNWKPRMLSHSLLTKYGYESLPPVLEPIASRLGFFLFGNFPGNFSEVSARVDLFNKEKDYVENMKYAADFEFWSRMTKEKNILLSDANVVYIRRHDRVAETYMSTRGEFFWDTLPVYERLVEELSPYYDRKLLIRYYNIETRSFQLRDALIAILHGRFANFKAFMSAKSVIFWPKWKQLIVCLPLAIYEKGRLRVALSVARKIGESYKK